MKNITITFDEKTAAWARSYAAREEKSLSRFLGDLLQKTMREAREYEEAMLTSGVKPEEAWNEVRLLLAWAPLPADRELLLLSREIENRFHTSWWDSMIVAAAHMQSCTILLSEDFQDGMVFDRITVRNPFRTKVAEASPVYDAPLKPVARHRPRGRPSRITT